MTRPTRLRDFFENQRPFAALALLGITQLRMQDYVSAELSFGRAIRLIDSLLAVEPFAVQVLDTSGLVFAGLARAERRNNFDLAIIAYRRARDRTRAPGIVLRAVRLLDELLDGDDSINASKVLDAAGGLAGR